MTNVSIGWLGRAAYRAGDDGANWCGAARSSDALSGEAARTVRPRASPAALRQSHSVSARNPRRAVIGPITDKDPVKVA